MKKRILVLVMTLVMLLCACAKPVATTPDITPTPEPSPMPAATAEPAPKLQKDVVIVYTNDVHCGNEDASEYAKLASYVKSLRADGNDVLLVDAGDHIQGGPIGTVSKGEHLINIMNMLEYDAAVPGNHEFDYGMDRFLELAEMAKFPYLSCNFRKSEDEQPVFDAYKMFDFDGVKIALVGICTPKTITSSTPKYFQDDNGNFIYDFCQDADGTLLYKTVQESVDAARAEGAAYVIAVGHLGIEYGCSPWMSSEVITHTTGIDAFIDGHSHSVVNCERVKNADGDYVLLTQTGTKLADAGMLLINKNGSMSTGLVEMVSEPDAEMQAFIDGIHAEYAEEMQKVVAKSDVPLTITVPESDPPVRIVRNMETNLGDLCADAYRVIGEADIGFANGGGIRTSIPAGDITYEQIISVHPFGNNLCVVEATGDEILQALEMGARVAPEETGGFLQVSGLTYEIHTYIPSPVVLTDDGMFDHIEGENRVKNVMVGDAPLDPAKTYTLASHDYMLQNAGDGYTMFKDNTFVKTMVMVDNQMLISYITDTLGGTVGAEYADPYGQGRIVIFNEKPAA